MKKTVIALFALAGVASSAETLNLTECVQGKNAEFILTLDLKPDQIAALLPNLNMSNEGVIFAAVQSGNQITGLAMGKWGGGNVYMELPSERDQDRGQYAAGLAAGATNGVTVKGYSLEGQVSSDIEGLSFTNMVGSPPYDWSAVDSAILTLHHGSTLNVATVNLALTVDGTVYNVTGSCTNDSIVWATYGNATTLSYNTNFVNSAHVEVIPEPATATLSLLALAGLAARRRRK